MNESSSEYLSYYEEQYSTHPVHSAIQDLIESVSENEPENLGDADIQIRALPFRLIEVLSFAQAILEKLDPIFIHKGSLDNINRGINNTKSAWVQFCSNINQSSNLDQQIESLVANIQQISKNDFNSESLSNLFDEYYQKCIALKRNVTSADNEISSMQRKLENLNNDIEKQKNILDSIITNHTEKFNESQSKKAEEFIKINSEIRTQINDFIQKSKDELNSIKDQAEQNFISVKDYFEEKGEDVLIELRKKQDEATEVVGTVVTSVMGGNYKKIAEREYKSAWTMRILALLSFGGIIIVLFLLVNNLAQNESIDWGISVVKLIIGLVLTGPAVYCAKESSRHWNLEKEYRRMALELSAIEPYLDRLKNPEEKKNILAKTANAYFGAQSNILPTDEKDEMASIRLSLKTIVEFFQQIAATIQRK